MASSNPAIDPNQTIYVRNLNEDIKKDELKRTLYCLFSAYGKVISIVASKTTRDRGQAFIAFSDIVSATAALRGLQGFNFYGKSMEIQYAKSKSHAISKLDGTYKQPPMKKLGGAGSTDADTTSSLTAVATKREREADSDSDDSAMSE
ncbi:U2 snRNP complex subunit msl1 [Dissophora globulifera]|uniref:U2 snRNP complex subunit msl1 n=1 Tax=Dissophora globulifera TaxID=979702 RepID=A0A9P6RBL7_9FUNG|nr:U2 snRNP complex subunit msl1 [Dissophora globulifera]